MKTNITATCLISILSCNITYPTWSGQEQHYRLSEDEIATQMDWFAFISNWSIRSAIEENMPPDTISDLEARATGNTSPHKNSPRRTCCTALCQRISRCLTKNSSEN